MEEIKYSIGEMKEAVEETVIEKRGDVITFTLGELDRNQMVLFKMQKELTAQIKLEDAKTENIEQFHAFVKDMSPLDVSTVHLFHETKTMRDACAKKLIEVNEAIDNQLNDRAEIIKQLPELALGVVMPAQEPEVLPEETPA